MVPNIVSVVLIQLCAKSPLHPTDEGRWNNILQSLSPAKNCTKTKTKTMATVFLSLIRIPFYWASEQQLICNKRAKWTKLFMLTFWISQDITLKTIQQVFFVNLPGYTAPINGRFLQILIWTLCSPMEDRLMFSTWKVNCCGICW